ncbi:MAG: TlpA family protein disulfide reductase [Bacteroidetes bacterium]|nr:TlpA family protein disulfide reductase [Bacteroidota bacterium]
MKIKTNILVSLILALILTYFIATQMRKPKSPLLKTELTDLQNQKFDGILLKNKVFIVSYFQTWCGDCVKEQPELLKLKERFGDSLIILMVSDEPIEKITAFKTRFKSPLDFYNSSKALKSIDIKRFPTTFLIDKKGKTVDVRVEGIDWFSDKTLETIEALVKE